MTVWSVLDSVESDVPARCSDFDQALTRLNAMTRGIGDPLVAIYTRAYICRV